MAEMSIGAVAMVDLVAKSRTAQTDAQTECVTRSRVTASKNAEQFLVVTTHGLILGFGVNMGARTEYAMPHR
jgi:hypothetical protein